MLNQYIREREEALWNIQEDRPANHVAFDIVKLKQFQKDTILGMLEKMKKRLEKTDEENEFGVQRNGDWGHTYNQGKKDGLNQALQDQISHLDTIINSIREE